jgi:hypothetical protein
MNRRAYGALFIGLGILWACKEDEKRPPPLTDPGTSVNPGGGGGGGGGSSGDGGIVADTGAGTRPDASAECSDLDDPTTLIDQNNVSSDAPPGTGGQLVDGIYDLTVAERYVGISGQAGPTGLTYREVVQITGGSSFERVRLAQSNNGPIQTTNASFVLTSASPNLTLTPKCPTTGAGETYGYTLENGKLTLLSATGESLTYTAR